MTQQRKRLGLTFPMVLYKKVSELAAYQGKTINSTCLDIVWNYFEDKEASTKERGENK